MQMAGGFGVVGPIEKLYAALLQTERPIELVVAAGRNTAIPKRLEKIPIPPRHRARVLPFTTEIDEYMAAADLIVSKPGGLTVAETLARGAVLVMVQPVPGQESRNADYLLENGAAVKVNMLPLLSYKVDSLLADPVRLAQLRANAVKLADRTRPLRWPPRRYNLCGNRIWGSRSCPIKPSSGAKPRLTMKRISSTRTCPACATRCRRR